MAAKKSADGGAAANTSFKIKLRARDNAPLTMAELLDGLYDVMRRLTRYQAYRAKWVTLYLTVVDENGREVRLDESGEWTIYSYRSAADEHGA